MKRICIVFLINILKISLFFITLIEKIFEILSIPFSILFLTAMLLFFKVTGRIKSSRLSEMIKELMFYHSDTFYEDEILSTSS